MKFALLPNNENEFVYEPIKIPENVHFEVICKRLGFFNYLFLKAF